MSKAEILDLLPKLSAADRIEIFSFLWDFEEKDFFLMNNLQKKKNISLIKLRQIIKLILTRVPLGMR